MREVVLHHIWKSQKFPLTPLRTTKGDSIQVLSAGKHNLGSGPDFSLSIIRINDRTWSGDVELHLKASDWYAHGHQWDGAYDTVILHVVWSADREVFRKDGSEIPTLELSKIVTTSELSYIQNTLKAQKPKGLPCEGVLNTVPPDLISLWREELFWQRLQEKRSELDTWLEATAHDWDQVCFKSLLKAFGLNLNGQAFLSLANALPFSVLRKIRSDLTALESVFFGLCGLLHTADPTDAYRNSLLIKYQFLKLKYKLSEDACHKPEFFSLRPGNFPTIRLSQLANLYHQKPSIFEKIRKAKTLSAIKAILQTQASPYWSTHYVFGKTCGHRIKKITARFTDLLILNAVFPLLFSYGYSVGKSVDGMIRKWAMEIKAEQNKVSRLFQSEGISLQNAFESQAVIHLHKNFCSKNKCLQCDWGTYILYGK